MKVYGCCVATAQEVDRSAVEMGRCLQGLASRQELEQTREGLTRRLEEIGREYARAAEGEVRPGTQA
jgi:hypothetical protein